MVIMYSDAENPLSHPPRPGLFLGFKPPLNSHNNKRGSGVTCPGQIYGSLGLTQESKNI